MCITFLCKDIMKKNLTLCLNVFSFSVVCECVCEMYECVCAHVCMSVHAMCAHVCMCTCACVQCDMCAHTRVCVYPNSSSCFFTL